MTRRPRAETRRLLLDTGVRLLLDKGLRGGCDHVGMADVLHAVHDETGQRITNASVYGRIWDNQDAFHRDLLLAAAEFYPSGEEEATTRTARAVIDRSDISTLGGRVEALRQICRQAGAAHAETMVHSRAWQTWLAIWAITVSTPEIDDDEERGPALARRHERAVSDFADVIGSVLDELGFRVRSPFTLEQLGMSLYALSEGLALHDRFAPNDLVNIASADDPDLRGEPWTLFAIGVEALVARFTEAKPGR
jgi:hypothetical protein